MYPVRSRRDSGTLESFNSGDTVRTQDQQPKKEDAVSQATGKRAKQCKLHGNRGATQQPHRRQPLSNGTVSHF